MKLNHHIKIAAVFLALLTAFASVTVAYAAEQSKISSALQDEIHSDAPDDVIPVYVNFRYDDRPDLKKMPSYPADINAACNELKDTMLDKSCAVAEHLSRYSDFEVVEYLQYSNVILIDIEAQAIPKIAACEDVLSLHYSADEKIAGDTIPEGMSRSAYRKLSPDIRERTANSQPDDLIPATIYRYGSTLLLSDYYESEYSRAELNTIISEQNHQFASVLAEYADFHIAGDVRYVLNVETTAAQLYRIAACSGVESICYAGLTPSNADDPGELPEPVVTEEPTVPTPATPDSLSYESRYVHYHPGGMYYLYEELYRHYGSPDQTQPDWVLVSARSGYPAVSVKLYCTVGHRMIPTDKRYTPFTTMYGIYDVKADKFYDIRKIEPTQYDQLSAYLDEAKIGYSRGDVDLDKDITVFDVTMLQRHLAELEILQDIDKRLQKFTADADTDGNVTIFDATEIQRHLAGMSSLLTE